MTSDCSSKSQCLLFAPAEYFEDNASKLQLARTLSSSFRVNLSNNSSLDSSDDQSTQQQQSPTSSQQPTNSSSEFTPPLVYVLCVPISNELESEWRGVTHTISTNKHLTSIFPLNTHWKTTTIFLLTQQTTNLEMFEESFRDRLSKTNIQQNDLYKFDAQAGQILQKRSCFEKVDRAMNDLAHAILTLSNSIANNVEQFEKLILNQHVPIDTRNYIHTEERVFAFAMDIIRETSHFTTQLDSNTLTSQAERQISFANVWLNFVRKKKSLTNTWKFSTNIPMWLLPGIHFLRYICALQFTEHVDNDLFSRFYENIARTMDYLHHSHVRHDPKVNIRPKKPKIPASPQQRKEKLNLSRIAQIDLLDRNIDRRRKKEDLIGKIIQYDEGAIKMSFISKRMEQDLAYLKIRNFHKLNLLSRGQYATSQYQFPTSFKNLLFLWNFSL